ncbi:MAG: cytochrome c3 family protein [Eggerthellaceae bacterium]|nr:cytochrome c3 family protein [Eggerthellaceae bacterium]
MTEEMMTETNTASPATKAASISEAGTSSAGSASPKRPRKKALVAAVVVVAIAAVGAGLFAWHEQPSFCSAICHTPMDAYGKTYLDGTQDEFGNSLTAEESNSMLAYAHSQYMGGITCLDCHVPTLDEQVSEGLAWVAGNYVVEGENANGDALLEERTLADLTAAREVAPESFCLNDSCHVTTPDRAALFEKTKYLESVYNPHSDRHGDIDCGTCHKAHSQSVNYCTECHASAPVPEGWLTMAEAQEKGIVETVNQ